MRDTNEIEPPGGRPLGAVARVAIADQFPIFRHGLSRLLKDAGRFEIVGQDGLTRIVALVRESRPDVLLLGPRAASNPWIETLTTLAGAGLSVRTILLAKSLDTPDVTEALRRGAWGVVAKDSTADELFKSIDAVFAGEYWVGGERASGDVAASVRRLDHDRRRDQGFGLTRRELEIVRAIVNGDTNKEIAAGLAISPNTVKRHLLHIFNKTGASSRVEVALFASHHRLLDGI